MSILGIVEEGQIEYSGRPQFKAHVVNEPPIAQIAAVIERIQHEAYLDASACVSAEVNLHPYPRIQPHARRGWPTNHRIGGRSLEAVIAVWVFPRIPARDSFIALRRAGRVLRGYLYLDRVLAAEVVPCPEVHGRSLAGGDAAQVYDPVHLKHRIHVVLVVGVVRRAVVEAEQAAVLCVTQAHPRPATSCVPACPPVGRRIDIVLIDNAVAVAAGWSRAAAAPASRWTGAHVPELVRDLAVVGDADVINVNAVAYRTDAAGVQTEPNENVVIGQVGIRSDGVPRLTRHLLNGAQQVNFHALPGDLTSRAAAVCQIIPRPDGCPARAVII